VEEMSLRLANLQLRLERKIELVADTDRLPLGDIVPFPVHTVRLLAGNRRQEIVWLSIVWVGAIPFPIEISWK
jgi:hypothetical protein